MTPLDDELLTLKEVADILRLSAETVRTLCVTGRLAWVDVGTGGRHNRRVLRSTLDAFMGNERRGAIRQDVRNVMATVEAVQGAEERW